MSKGRVKLEDRPPIVIDFEARPLENPHLGYFQVRLTNVTKSESEALYSEMEALFRRVFGENGTFTKGKREVPS